MKQLRQKKWFRTLCWYIVDGALAGATVVLAGLEGTELALYGSIGFLILERVTKYVNEHLFDDLGVTKK